MYVVTVSDLNLAYEYKPPKTSLKDIGKYVRTYISNVNLGIPTNDRQTRKQSSRVGFNTLSLSLSLAGMYQDDETKRKNYNPLSPLRFPNALNWTHRTLLFKIP